jgi:hypothetical protein
MKKHKLPLLSISEKAAIRRDWATDNLSAQIHAMTGQDGPLLVNKAGRVMFVVLGAAIAVGIEASHPDMRILRASVNALHEQAGESVIDETRRASIASGLDAAERLNSLLPLDAIFRAACDMNAKMKRPEGVSLADFQALIPASPSTLGAPAA